MENKKAKIIEFDTKTINLIKSYGKERGINTFSGVVRKMVDRELERYGLREKENDSNAKNLDIMSELSDKEKQLYQGFTEMIQQYNLFRSECSKVRDDLKERSSEDKNGRVAKSIYEKMTWYYTDEEKIDELYDIARIVYIENQYGVIQIYAGMKQINNLLLQTTNDINIDIYNLENVGELDIDLVKELISNYAYVVRKGQKEEWVHQYNDFVVQYNECKEGNISKNVFLRTLSDFII